MYFPLKYIDCEKCMLEFWFLLSESKTVGDFHQYIAFITYQIYTIKYLDFSNLPTKQNFNQEN